MTKKVELSMSIDTVNKSPADYGFRMPAEWEEHERTWMMWPCREIVWPDMAATKLDYVKVAHAIREFEPLTMVVNPKDERFKDFVGKVVTIPIVGRKIKIIEDDYADPEQGTGALKITPAHDFNDYDVGQRNNLEIINIFTEAGKINENAPKEYIGLDRFEARKRILKKLKEKFL